MILAGGNVSCFPVQQFNFNPRWFDEISVPIAAEPLTFFNDLRRALLALQNYFNPQHYMWQSQRVLLPATGERVGGVREREREGMSAAAGERERERARA